ncbi:hypothetical protein ACO1O0_000319 [Amphichorda felina]
MVAHTAQGMYTPMMLRISAPSKSPAATQAPANAARMSPCLSSRSRRRWRNDAAENPNTTYEARTGHFGDGKATDDSG